MKLQAKKSFVSQLSKDIFSGLNVVAIPELFNGCIRVLH